MQADRIYCGDALTVLKTLPDISVNCCITSPPYYALRDYGVDGQIGREETPALYVERLTSIFREVRRVLTPDGTLWLNIADTYAGKGNQGDSLDPKYPNGRTGQAVALNGKVEGCKAKGHDRHPVAAGVRAARRRLVSALGHHLDESESHAGKHQGQAKPLL